MAAPSSHNLGRFFEASAALRTGQDFLVDSHLRLDGRGANDETRRRAGLLAETGAKPGGRIAFLSRPSAAHVVTWFAAVRLGATATNLHVLETDRRLAETLDWLEADLLVCDAEFLDRARAIQAESGRRPVLATLDQEVEGVASVAGTRQAALAPQLDESRPHEVAAIVLSSGSTGRPKGVIHTHATLVANAAAGPAVYGEIAPRDSVLVAIGTSFGGWLNIVLPFLAGGAKLAFQRRFDPHDFLRGLVAEGITHAPLVPTMWRQVVAAGPEGYDLGALRSAFMSGEAAAPDIIETVSAQIAPSVRAAYLSTEGGCGCGIVSEWRDGRLVIAGAPVPGCEALIAPVAESGDREGEILLKGPSLARGYWRDPERTKRSFRDGWWRTGDVGRMTGERTVQPFGRVDHVINSGGVKIQAEDVELALMRHPDVAQAAVVGVADPVWGESVEGFIVPKAPGLDPDAVLAWCRRDGVLPGLKLPKRLHVRDRLPTGATGKLYRPALAAEARCLR